MPEYQLREYLTKGGRSPFSNWLNDLRDIRARARIRTRLDRLRLGNPGDHAAIANGLLELRLFFGPGYRVYFGLPGKRIVLLLWGGKKDTQQTDINIAAAYWADYRNRTYGN